MKLRSFLFYMVLLLSFVANAQIELECKTKLSLFHEPAKAKKYDTAYEPWLYVKSNCPDLSLAIYTDGEKILKHKIEKTKGEVQLSFINTLLELWKARSQYYYDKTPQGEYEAKACQLKYDYKEELGKDKTVLYNCFNEAFMLDKETFTHPKGLYTYFSLMVNLFDEGKKSDSELFDTYDNVIEKIEVEIQNYSEKLNALVEKIDNGGTLNRIEKNRKKAYESYLKNYALIKDNIDALADIRAKCDNLIPLYYRDFENNKNDSIWLKRSVSRMYHKDCTKDELYEKLVKQYDAVAPSADTKIFVATILFQKGKDEEAYKYLEEAYKLEKRPYKKSNIAIRIGVILKNKGQYSKARGFLLEALKLNPSNGKPHLTIANMYALSAKNKSCGKDNIYQRAVYWLAAKEAKKASRVDPTLQKLVNQSVRSYEAKAPTREEIFRKNMAGKTIKIKCWINRSVVAPKLD